MKWILVFAGAFFTYTALSQNPAIKVRKSTSQQTMHGAAPGSSTTYRIEFKKITKNEIKIDSILTIADQKKIDFNLFRKKGKSEIPHDGLIIASKDKSVFILSFGQTTRENFDRRGRPVENPEEDILDFSQGVIIYFTNGEKQDSITVKDFKVNEEVIAP